MSSTRSANTSQHRSISFCPSWRAVARKSRTCDGNAGGFTSPALGKASSISGYRRRHKLKNCVTCCRVRDPYNRESDCVRSTIVRHGVIKTMPLENENSVTTCDNGNGGRCRKVVTLRQRDASTFKGRPAKTIFYRSQTLDSRMKQFTSRNQLSHVHISLRTYSKPIDKSLQQVACIPLQSMAILHIMVFRK